MLSKDIMMMFSLKSISVDISTNDLVKEIKEINGLSSDYITEGNYIIIPVYE